MLKDEDSAIEWSLDGRELFFTDRKKNKPAVFAIARDGSSRRFLNEAELQAAAVLLSPDEKYLAFYAIVGGRPQIRVTNADGTAARDFATGKFKDCRPLSWLPDTAILFLTCSDPSNRKAKFRSPLGLFGQVLLKANASDPSHELQLVAGDILGGVSIAPALPVTKVPSLDWLPIQ